MRYIKYGSLLILVLFSSANVFAHALFIDTETEGKAGKLHNITIYYSEPGDSKREVLKDWWSDTVEFILWLNLPNGTRERLNVTQHKDHFTSSFTPKSDGIYYVSIHHSVASVAVATQYQFNASSKIIVGNTTTQTDLKLVSKSSELLLYKSSSVGKNVALTFSDKGKAIANSPVTAFASNGWRKTVDTDAFGVAVFELEWLGKYVFEASKKEEAATEAYQNRERIATTTLNFSN